MSEQIQVVVIDDEPLARARIRMQLDRWPAVTVAAECGDVDSGVDAIRKHSPEIVFLDVQMPGKTGFDVIREISVAKMPLTIFVTAYDQYAVAAFDVHALDYLLKPFEPARFDEAIGRALATISERDDEDLPLQLQSLLNAVALKVPLEDRIMVKSAGRVVLVEISEIDWVQSAGNYVELHVGSKVHLSRDTLSNIEARLKGYGFVRIHRCTVVNSARIKELQARYHGDYVVTLLDGTEVTLSRRYRDRLSHLIGQRS